MQVLIIVEQVPWHNAGSLLRGGWPYRHISCCTQDLHRALERYGKTIIIYSRRMNIANNVQKSTMFKIRFRLYLEQENKRRRTLKREDLNYAIKLYSKELI